MISDFLDEGFESSLKIANKKHDIVALKINDRRESDIPNIGLIQMTDIETGKTGWVDTSDKDFQKKYKTDSLKRNESVKEVFRRSGVDFAEIATHQSYVQPLIGLFKSRESRR